MPPAPPDQPAVEDELETVDIIHLGAGLNEPQLGHKVERRAVVGRDRSSHPRDRRRQAAQPIIARTASSAYPRRRYSENTP